MREKEKKMGVFITPILILAPPPPEWITFLEILALNLEILFQFINGIRTNCLIVCCEI
jgi:hypothetical protein